MEPPRKKVARVVAIDTLHDDTRVLTFVPAEPLVFVGGQFVSVDTGKLNASGKPWRRAYSLLSRDDEPDRFQVAVKRIEGGYVSGLMHALAVGDEIRFTGPWGTFHPPADAAGRLLVLATDTGVTAALGLVRSQRVRPRLAATTFVWLRTGPDDFLPEAMVRELLPASCADVRIGLLPPVAHVERVPHVRAILRDVQAHGPLAHAFVAGDGAVTYALLDDLVAAGVPATRDSLESFFNFPRKSAAT